MSFTIDTAFVKQYHANIERLLQQTGTQLRPYVRVEQQNGEEGYWEQIDKVEAQEVFARFADSPQMDTPHARRKVMLRQFDVGDFIDKFDEVKMLIDPSSTYVQNFVSALNRAVDMVIIGRNSLTDAITNASSGGFFNTAYTGKNGTSTVSFPAGNVVAVDFSSTGTNSNLTITKVIEGKRLLMSFFNQPAGIQNATGVGIEPWYHGFTASQLAALLKTTQVTSADYNSVKALVNGTINTFMGFQWIWSEFFMTNATPYRLIPVWTKNGMLAAIGRDISTFVMQRPDKRMSWYAYAMLSVGSTRMQENKIVQILCDETVV